MTNENTPTIPVETIAELLEENFEEEFESAGEYHRMAARHFEAAAKHHRLAATSDDDGDNERTAQHAFQAFRHQLNAVQYAEIAVMDNENLDEELDDDLED
jgi:hypothetical protein